MYETRPLSLYKSNPWALFLPPPEGPNGGYLVLQDDASTPRYFFGLLKDSAIKDHPFPQNKLHVVTHGSGEDKTHYPVYFIPAINLPLSSNTYYAIKTKGSNKGKACASSRDEDMTPCCFGRRLNDAQPRPLDPADVYQQFKVSVHKNWHSSWFAAASVASDGHPPWFLLRSGWSLYSKTSKSFSSLGEAAGLDAGLRARLPDFNFHPSYSASRPVVVGKWYSPFMFVKEWLTPREQVKQSMYYEVTLEQQWERISFLGNQHAGLGSSGNNTVFVDVIVPTESVMVAERDGVQTRRDDGMVWFVSLDGEKTLGLSSLVVRRMMWEEERAGWAPNAEEQVKVSRIEEFGGVGSWGSFGCYMLVERFVFKRMDGRVVLTYGFNHTHRIRSKWE